MWIKYRKENGMKIIVGGIIEKDNKIRNVNFL